MFIYKNDLLGLNQGDFFIPLKDIVQNQEQAFYLYDVQGLREWYRFFVESSPSNLQVFFSMKSNSNKMVLKALADEGSGVDVVSGGEASRAQQAGFPVQKIIFSGVGKSVLELEEAVEKGFFQINVESLEELKRLALICRKKKKICRIGLRINPNVDFEAHPHIKTGLRGHKFGFEEQELPFLLEFIRSCPKQLFFQGLSMHLGSQIFNLEPLFQAIKHLKGLYENLKKEQYPLKVLDIGGGLAVNYQKEGFREEKERIESFGRGLKELFKGFDGIIASEPGRFLIARFGLLCAQIEYIKRSPSKPFIILNSGMNHFLRPALYGAEHRVLPFQKTEGPYQNYDVVGPICETGDTIAKKCPLPPLKSGDWLAIADTGAYGFVLSNHYNLQPLVREVAFDKGQEIK